MNYDDAKTVDTIMRASSRARYLMRQVEYWAQEDAYEELRYEASYGDLDEAGAVEIIRTYIEEA